MAIDIAVHRDAFSDESAGRAIACNFNFCERMQMNLFHPTTPQFQDFDEAVQQLHQTSPSCACIFNR
jgi:hypothetical protein